MDYTDKRQEVIDKMNQGRAERGQILLTPRQEHLVREFFNDEGRLASAEDRALLMELLKSNSA